MQWQGTSAEELELALSEAEGTLSTGNHLAIQLCTYNHPSDTDIQEFYSSASNLGIAIDNLRISHFDGFCELSFDVAVSGNPVSGLGFAPAALIGIIPTVAIVGLIAFGIINIQEIASAILPILVVAVAGLIAFGVILSEPKGIGR